MSDILGAGLAFPIHVDPRGSVALARGQEDVEQALHVILSTAPGERPMRPEFGCAVHDFVFDTIDAETVGKIDVAVRDALVRWEPRIDVEKIDFDLDEVASGRLQVTITYSLRATNARYNLVYPFYVIPAEESE